MEVVCERQADAVVELVEVPLEWFPGLQHDHVQGGVGVVEGPLTLEGEEVLLKKSQTGSVKRYLVQLKDAVKENKVIGTRGQGVRVWSPRELTTEHLTKPSLRLD